MGGVFGHMSHIYDNPTMTFGQIKDIMTKASAGDLENVTEKTDGQNLFVSYNVGDGTQRWATEAQVRAARNKGDIKNGGMTPAQLATKFAGRGALTDAFVNAFRAFELTVDKFNDADKLALFGPDTNIYYNAEVMDPGSPNVINYDTKTFLIHRAGHSEYDKETGNPVSKDEGFSEQQAQILQNALEQSQEELEKDDFRVQVNAIRNLEALSDDVALTTAIAGIDKAMSEARMTDKDTIADYMFAQWKELVSVTLPELTDKQEKLIIDRVMTDYYGALEGEGPLKSRGLELSQITKAVGRPELNKEIVSLIKGYPQYFKDFVFPIEKVIHRFAIEILRAVKSAYIIAAGGNEKEVARLQALVGKAINTIELSGNDEAMELIKSQVEKLSKLEDDGSIGDVDLSMISSAAEGIVFDYDGHTYKFTGGFAPANQILGLFKYGRKGIPAFAEELDEGVWDTIKTGAVDKAMGVVKRAVKKTFPALKGTIDKIGESDIEGDKRTIAIYPGRFQPMGRHHFQTFQEIANDYGIENTFIATSDAKLVPGSSPLNFEQKRAIIKAHGVPDSQIRKVKNPYFAKEIYEEFGDPEDIEIKYFVGAKDMNTNPRFQKTSGTTKQGYDWSIGVAPHVELDIPGVGEMCGTSLRGCLKGADPEKFESIMGWFDQEVYDMLQNTLEEVSSVSGGSMSVYADRAPGVVGSEKEKDRHPKDFISEVSAMMTGDVEGDAVGASNGPWHGFNAAAFNKRQKKDATLQGVEELIGEEEELVSEVIDYLLGITVG
tara:strand:+ start:4326 stop:6653 length:2328 start_codon:yes stop_codon:yes gene_type:complete